MKQLILISVYFFMTNCKKGDDCCVNRELSVKIEYFNEEGEDLLNPDNSGHFIEKDIKNFYLVDGEKKEIFRGNLDMPKMFRLLKPYKQRGYALGLSLNDISNKKIKTTYLQLNESDTDTITHSLVQTKNSNQLLDKVWYNGKLSENGYAFRIAK